MQLSASFTFILLPLTRKRSEGRDAFQFTYYQLFSVDRSEVIRIRGNQGSTAHPEVLR